MLRSLYCYCVSPIDFWFGALTQEDIFKIMIKEHKVYQGEMEQWNWIARITAHFNALEAEAMRAFEQIGWELDVSYGPFYFFVPGDIEMKAGIIIKQGNNGTCYVASPVPLPHLLDQLNSNMHIKYLSPSF